MLFSFFHNGTIRTYVSGDSAQLLNLLILVGLIVIGVVSYESFKRIMFTHDQAAA